MWNKEYMEYRRKPGQSNSDFEKEIFGEFVPHDERPKSQQVPPPAIRTFEEPLTECSNCNGSEFVTLSTCVKCEHTYARAENHNAEISQLRSTIRTQAEDLAVLAAAADISRDCSTCTGRPMDKSSAPCGECNDYYSNYRQSPAVALAIKYGEE